MELQLKNIDKFIVVGDRVLIRPEEQTNKTDTGLFLPPGVVEKEKIQSGYVIKVGRVMRLLQILKTNHGKNQKNQLSIFHCRLK